MSLRIGAYEITTVIANRFRLDGGAMFGNVPKVLWNREQPADESNRIQLAARCLLLRGEGRIALVDTGCGTKLSEKEREIFVVDHTEDSLLTNLAAHGVQPEDVTDVIITHLHFDHAGGGTTRQSDGTVGPTFPNATYHVQRSNLATAREPNPRERASYLADDFEPVAEAGNLLMVKGNVQLLPGVYAFVSHGHTTAMQSVEVRGKDANEPSLFYPADLMPTDSHLKVPYTMGYDLHAAWILEEKQRFLEKIRPEKDFVVFEHAPKVGAVTIREGRKYHEIAEHVDL